MILNTTQKRPINITGLLGWNRYGFVWSLTLLVALFSLVRPAAGRPVDQPNIVIFYIDDMSEGLLATYGSDLVPTPNIDAIAKRGVRFTHGYVTAPMCTPSRIGLLTGRYQQRIGHDGVYRHGKGVKNPTPVKGMDLDLTIFPQYLKKLGYVTGISGKWHLGHEKGYLPASRGFDFSFGSVGNLSFNRESKKGEGDFYRGAKILEKPGWLVTSPMYAEEAVGFIEQHQDKPFFLYVSFNATHAPARSSDHWKDKLANIEKKKLSKAAQVAELDEAIGTVMKSLRDNDLVSDTLIFCLADNGRSDFSGGLNGLEGSNGLRGDKWETWEAGIRVPWIVQWEGRIPAGAVIDEPVIQLDILPTALAAAGSDEGQFNGLNLLPLLKGEVDRLEKRPLYWRVASQRKGIEAFAIRYGDWKLAKPLRTEDTVVLVNLANDRGELKDVSKKYPEKVSELQELWDKWNTSMKAPAW